MGVVLENGYEMKTTFWDDFTIADLFGEHAIEDTFNRAFKEWKNKTVDYLSLSLDEKCDIVKEVIEVIYCWKPIRTELCLEIHNKLTGETCTYYLDSYHKKILSIEKISSNVEL